MIRVHAQADGRPVVLGDFSDGSVFYVDADWVAPDVPGVVPALVADSDGRLRWSDTDSVDRAEGLDTDTAAGLAFLAIARDAARAAASTVGNRRANVHVQGNGIVSRLVRAILSDRFSRRIDDRDSRPTAVVDTTGDPARIAEMTRRLADLGTLILVGEPLGRRLSMQLYPDIHARGLHVVGISRPLSRHESDPGGGESEPLFEILRTTLCHAFAGDPLPDGAAWYRVSFPRLARTPTSRLPHERSANPAPDR